MLSEAPIALWKLRSRRILRPWGVYTRGFGEVGFPSFKGIASGVDFLSKPAYVSCSMPLATSAALRRAADAEVVIVLVGKIPLDSLAAPRQRRNTQIDPSWS